MSTDLSIDVKGLTKSYHAGSVLTPVLKGVDLSVRRGELYFIVGPSGCGKTTLISLLCGTLRPDEGQLTVLGYDLRKLSESRITQFRAEHVGFVFQQFNLLPTLTAAENVAIPLKLQGCSASKAHKAAVEVLSKVGLADKIHSRPKLLSGGQQQRVAIARALVHNPSLIVCDEPTSALDSETGQQVMSLLAEPSAKRTVIVVTHDPRIYSMAHRIAEMEDGLIRKVIDQTKPSLTSL
jgi:putative ABC transport system ATP-binding protein